MDIRQGPPAAREVEPLGGEWPSHAAGDQFSLVQVRGTAGRHRKNRILANLKGLGLGRVGQIRVCRDDDAVWGMIRRVQDLVAVKNPPPAREDDPAWIRSLKHALVGRSRSARGKKKQTAPEAFGVRPRAKRQEKVREQLASQHPDGLVDFLARRGQLRTVADVRHVERLVCETHRTLRHVRPASGPEVLPAHLRRHVIRSLEGAATRPNEPVTDAAVASLYRLIAQGILPAPGTPGLRVTARLFQEVVFLGSNQPSFQIVVTVSVTRPLRPNEVVTVRATTRRGRGEAARFTSLRPGEVGRQTVYVTPDVPGRHPIDLVVLVNGVIAFRLSLLARAVGAPTVLAHHSKRPLAADARSGHGLQRMERRERREPAQGYERTAWAVG